MDVTQNSLVYILKIIGAETEEALEMLRCVVQGFNQLNIILLQNIKSGAVCICELGHLTCEVGVIYVKGAGVSPGLLFATDHAKQNI